MIVLMSGKENGRLKAVAPHVYDCTFKTNYFHSGCSANFATSLGDFLQEFLKNFIFALAIPEQFTEKRKFFLLMKRMYFKDCGEFLLK